MMVGEAGSLRLAGGSRRSSHIDGGGGGGGGYRGGPTSRHPRGSGAGQEHPHHRHSSFHPSPTSGYQTHQQQVSNEIIEPPVLQCFGQKAHWC